LAEVRRKAAALRLAAAVGEPLRPSIAMDSHASTTPTFREATKRFLAVHTKSLKNPKNAAQWGTTLQAYAWPTIGDVPVDRIDRGMVLEIVEPLWGVKTETANRVRARIAAVLDWAAEAGHRDPNLPNPARKEQFRKSLPAQNKVQKVRHHAALAIDETPAFIAELRAKDGVGPRAFEFCILSATRTSETLEARWSEIDLDQAVWTIPAERMKMGVAHRVPLSGRALAVLVEMKGQRRDDDYIFPGAKPGRPLSNMVFLMLLRKMGRDGVTAHGFRSTFRDWCAERTEVLGEVAEAALAHAVGSKVEAAYRRGDLFDKRRDLMGRWAEFLVGAFRG
jgi:integrase